METRQGMFFAFEGLDQSGKKTLSSWLTQHLTTHGIPVKTFAFPNYQGVIGSLIERYLGGEIAVSVQARHMLFAADRWQAYEEMSGLLQSGTSLVADRYSGSGIAYGLAHGLEQAWLEGLERGLLEPDFTFMVDIPVDASFARKPEERDRYESRIGLLRRVREVYLRLAEGYGWTVLNGLQSPEELQQELLQKLAESGYSF